MQLAQHSVSKWTVTQGSTGVPNAPPAATVAGLVVAADTFLPSPFVSIYGHVVQESTQTVFKTACFYNFLQQQVPEVRCFTTQYLLSPPFKLLTPTFNKSPLVLVLQDLV